MSMDCCPRRTTVHFRASYKNIVVNNDAPFTYHHDGTNITDRGPNSVHQIVFANYRCLHRLVSASEGIDYSLPRLIGLYSMGEPERGQRSSLRQRFQPRALQAYEA